MLNNIYALIYRGIPIVLKFSIFLLIPYFSNSETLGKFGLSIATISILSLLFGLETYYITSRTYIQNKDEFYNNYVSYISLSFIVSLLIILISVFSYEYFIKLNIYTFVAILGIAFTDFLLQEISRLKLCKGDMMEINRYYFIKNGLWPVVFITIFIQYGNVSASFFGYLIVNLIILFAYIIYYKSNIMSLKLNFNYSSVDFNFTYYLGKSLTSKLMSNLDRFLAAAYLGLEITGVVVFYASIMMSFNQIIEAISVSNYFKKIVKEKSEKILNEFTKNIVKVYSIFSIIVTILLYTTLTIMGSDMLNYFELIFFYFLAGFIMNISFPSNYVIYAFSKDRLVFYISILGLVVYSVSILFLINIYTTVYIFPISLILTWAIIFYINYKLSKKLLANE